MNRAEKINFVESLASVISDGVIKDIQLGRIPENWDGFELRQLLADRFADSAKIGGWDKRSKRRREYENTKLVKNL